MKKILALLMVLMLSVAIVGCGNSTETEPGSEDASTKVDFSRMRVVIGSSATSGDTFQTADLVTRYLKDELGVNAKVDAVGANMAFDELLKAKKDGSTIMIFHDQSYLGVEYGAYPETYALENVEVGPIVSINPGNAFLTSADAPYNNLAEAAKWLKENPKETITVAIEAGGVSQIGFDAFYNFVKETYGDDVVNRVKVYITGSQEDKNQALWDGNADIIHGSIPSNEEYTKDGVEAQIKMKFLGVTVGERVEGYDIPTFAEQGIKINGKPFVFDKEFFILMPKDVDPAFAEKIDAAVANIMANAKFEEELKGLTFVKNHKPAAEAKTYLLEKRTTMQEIIKNTPNLDDITAK